MEFQIWQNEKYIHIIGEMVKCGIGLQMYDLVGGTCHIWNITLLWNLNYLGILKKTKSVFLNRYKKNCTNK